MAVCRLAILSYRDNVNYGGYDRCDIIDCIAFARQQLEEGITVGFDGQDWRGFIKWATHKLKAGS